MRRLYCLRQRWSARKKERRQLLARLGLLPVPLLAVVVWDFLPAAVGPRRHWGRYPLRWVLIVAIFLLAVVFNPNVALLIVIGGVVGLLVFR